jgi:uncharacterized protein (TIGR02466 family)
MEQMKMSNELTTVEPVDQVDQTEQPQEPQKNVINFNPVFPTLTASVLLDFDVEEMKQEVYKLASDLKNFPGGYTSLISNPKAVDDMKNGQELLGALYQISLSFLREMKVEFNAEKCNLRTWVNVLRKDGYIPQQNHPLTQLTGMYFLSCQEKTSPIVLHNPTAPLRAHEHVPMRVQDFTAFTAPSMVIQPKENTLYVWPSWLKYEIPAMEIGGPLIYIGYSVDFLPTGS